MKKKYLKFVANFSFIGLFKKRNFHSRIVVFLLKIKFIHF